MKIFTLNNCNDNLSNATFVPLIGGLMILMSQQAFGIQTRDVISGEYHLEATVDELVTPIRKTEKWAKVWMPNRPGRYPLIVLLHGNHSTCGINAPAYGVRYDLDNEYTYTGSCPEGWEVVPQHLGYDYLAEPLAMKGFVVVSINANRGITGASQCYQFEEGVYPEIKPTGVYVPGYETDPLGYATCNIPRGHLILRHLELLSQWNRQGGEPKALGLQIQDRIDFSRVGMMGHSRGGEAVRIALNEYQAAGSPWPNLIGPVGFQSIFEIGPVDFSRRYNPNDVDWSVLLPACDGDVINNNGVGPFDRMMMTGLSGDHEMKSTFRVYGTNHNFYNTQWQTSDSWACLGDQPPLFTSQLIHGSDEVRQTASQTLVPFFEATLAEKVKSAKLKRFDPNKPLPLSLSKLTRIQRGYSLGVDPADYLVIDNFDQPTGISTNGYPDQAYHLQDYFHLNPNSTEFNSSFTGSLGDDPTWRAAFLKPQSGNSDGFLQLLAAPLSPGAGLDIRDYKTLEFRVSIACPKDLTGVACYQGLSQKQGDINFSLALIDGRNKMSNLIPLEKYSAVWKPVGANNSTPPPGEYSAEFTNFISQTVKVPLTRFTRVNKKDFSGIRIIFDKPNQDQGILLANVRFTRSSTQTDNTNTANSKSNSLVQMSANRFRNYEVPKILNLMPEAGSWSLEKAGKQAGNKTHVTSSKESITLTLRPKDSGRFPVMNSLPTLRIGYYLNENGRMSVSLDSISFQLDPEDLKKLSGGEHIILNMGATVLDYGKFDAGAL